MQSLTQQFLTFCRSKPADEGYSYSDQCGCAFYQFLTAAGYPVKAVWGFHWSDKDGRDHWFDGDNRLGGPLSMAIKNEPHRFGALADRLEKLV